MGQIGSDQPLQLNFSHSVSYEDQTALVQSSFVDPWTGDKEIQHYFRIGGC